MLLADFLNTAGRTYDEMKSNAAVMANELFECHGDMFIGHPFGPKAEFVVAGWSESHGADAFTISRDDKGAWIVTDTGDVLMAPGDDSIQQAALAALPAGVTCAAEMDAARDGLAMVRAQRDARLLENGRSAVGAFVQLTTVTRDGISTRILERWLEDWGDLAVPEAKAAA
jgi:hypothetical protein